MENKYKRITVPIENLFLHPDNARYAIKSNFTSIDTASDKLAIERMIRLKDTHIEKLLPDVAKNGLLPSLLPIIRPIESDNLNYVVYDANRRITTLKLLLVYKDIIDTFNIPLKIKDLIKSLSYSGPNALLCISSTDVEFINEQLRKIHTDDPGIGQVNWSPQAKDYHLADEGIYSNRYVLDRFLSFSDFTTITTKDNLFVRGWRSQIERFIDTPKTCEEYFGVNFDANLGNMTLYFDENFTVKLLSSLVADMINFTATKVAQTQKARFQYLIGFKERNPLLADNLNNPLRIYNAITNQFEISTLENPYKTPDSSPGNGDPNKKGSSNSAIDNSGSGNDDSDGSGSDNDSSDNSGSDNDSSDNSGSDNDNSDDSKKSKKNNRKRLIEDNQLEKITDKRAQVIYEELANLPVNNFHNISAITFRSLFDITIFCYLNKFCPDKIVFNNLPENFRKVVAKLEAKHHKDVLERRFPVIYMDIEKIINRDFHTIKILNTITHNNGYHPTIQEVFSIADNYFPFIYFIWDEINN